LPVSRIDERPIVPRKQGECVEAKWACWPLIHNDWAQSYEVKGN